MIRKRGKRYEVRWTEGGRKLGRTFIRHDDARAFDVDTKRRKQLGALAPSVLQSRQTLAQFVEDEWWPRHAIPNLKDSTRRRYLEVWGTHLLPRVGEYELRALSPMVIEDLRAQMSRQGVGIPTQRKALILLQGILRRAVVRGLIPSNPVQVVDKPRMPPARRPEPLEPATIERIRAQLKPRDATLVSLLAYAGLRPGEAIAVRWQDIEDRTLYVHASKTERARTVDLLAPLVQDLNEWRLACGRPADSTSVIARGAREWDRNGWGAWRRRIYQPAARNTGVTGDMRVYRLRGSFVSLLLWEGRSLPYVAEQAGHSIATLAKHYAGVMRELEDQPRVPAGEAIRQAREQTTRRVG
jgi:integrase